ncbi:MAG: protein kinase [Bdellovibrionales bacterium]
MQSLKNGTQLGAYTIVRLIARGGMGEVFEAHEALLDRRVALKIISPDDPKAHDALNLIQRFMQEARILAKVNHPNVVTIYSINPSAEPPFIAMEYVEGVSLREYLLKKAVPVPIAVDMFTQMLSGVKSLHDHNIVHRDLKPSNILLRGDGQIKILDFGIAKHTGMRVDTNPGVIVGTLPYMAPELKAGSPANWYTDCWSLGAIFYESLTRVRLMKRIQENRVVFTKDDYVVLPNQLLKIIERMCSETPEARYANAGAVLDDLQRYRQILSTPTSEDMAELHQRITKLVADERDKHDEAIIVESQPLAISAESLKPPSMQPPVPPRASSNRRRKSKSRISLNSLVMAAVLILAVVTFALKYYESEPKSAAPLSADSTHAVPQPSPTTALKSTETVVPLLGSPVRDELLIVNPGDSYRFRWQSELTDPSFEVQISTASDFDSIAMQTPASGRFVDLRLNLADGQYFWRLRSGSGETSIPESFRLLAKSPVALLNPEDGDRIVTVNRSSDLELSWQCRPGLDQYTLQLSKSEKFSAGTITRSVSGCQAVEKSRGNGTYFWRVIPRHSAYAQGPWSQVRTFVVESNKPRVHLAIATPKLKDATQVKTMRFDKARAPANVEKGEAAFALAWSPVKGAAKYKVQISRSKEFESVQAEKQIKGRSLRWKASSPGQSYWRVIAVGGQGQNSEPSGIGVLISQLPPPRLKPVYKLNPQASHLAWPAVPMANHYLVETSLSTDFENSQSTTVHSPKLALDKSVETTFVRVAASTETGARLSPFSSVAKVARAEQRPALVAPQPRSPPNGARAPSKNGSISVEFSWDSVNGAEGYTIEVAADETFATPLVQVTILEPRKLFQQVAWKGQIFWRVRAHTVEESSPWSEIWHFNVK